MHYNTYGTNVNEAAEQIPRNYGKQLELLTINLNLIANFWKIND